MLTHGEFDWLKRLEGEINTHWDDLTRWEKKFMEDLLERFARYGAKTIISKKQWEVIARVSEKAV